jgi:carbon-monoxide dehydrogenase medium subunit
MRFIPRNEMDIAVTGAGAWLRLGEGGETVEEARLALSAVAPTPVVADEAQAWLQGKPATEESFAEAGDIARKAAAPISDMRGPADYRTHLIGVLVKRALNGALGRARGGDRNPVTPSGINLC